MQVNSEQFAEASEKAVKEELRSAGWPVYEHYEVIKEGSETFVVASVSPASFLEPEPNEESADRNDEIKGPRLRKFVGRDPLEDAMRLYAPLTTPELIIELAELAEKEITPQDVLDWALVYGLLGIPDDDTVSTGNGFVNFQVKGGGRRESVRRFAEAAGEIKECLRIYEALTADEDADLEKLLSAASRLPPKVSRQWERRRGEERPWLFRVLGRMVQTSLNEHCYPQFATYTSGALADGRFALSWGFNNLLGAIWLQMAWLLEAEGERVTRCRLPDCLRVIRFEPGEPATNPGLRKNVRGKYKTRIDREFCKRRGCKQKYHYRKKAGWPGYD